MNSLYIPRLDKMKMVSIAVLLSTGKTPFENPPGGDSPEIWVGVCGPPLENLTLFQTKICDFPYPISDLTHNFLPYFRPDQVASSKNCTDIKVHTPYPISDQNGSKTIPFAAARTCMAYVREYPSGKKPVQY